MLRNQISEEDASYGDPTLGVNLRDGEQDLRANESRLMQNAEYYGGIRMRRGSIRFNTTSLGAFSILGGTKFYYGGVSPLSKRLIAYNNRVSVIADNGGETILTSAQTANLPTFFATWSITSKVYVTNGTDTLRSYDGTTWANVVGTNIPVVRARAVPVLDRILAITSNGIERTSPRDPTVWSANSSWATLRPQHPGLFTALYPYTLRGVDALYTGAIAFQERAHYLITGTDYGTDASAVSASSGENVSIQLLDPVVGTASPDSVCSVPGIGLFWFTTDLNVYWLPEGTLTGRFVGDKIQSTGTTAGIESVNKSQLANVWMAYFDHMLVLSVPVGTDTFSSTQWWMDIRSLRTYPERGPVWYGPMTGQTINRVWVENQQGDNKLVGGEGDSTKGAFVYQLRAPSVFTDATGVTDTAITLTYQTNFKDFGVPSREKYIQAVHMDLNQFSGTATLDLLSLDGTIVSGLSIDQVTNV